MAATQEFYVRNADETEARGPFNFDQLSSLAEAGRVTRDTLYYDAATEQWVTIASSTELCDKLYPPKKKLAVRAPEAANKVNPEATESRAPISVNDMLAASEGRTEDTKEKRALITMQEKCAKIGPFLLIALLLLSAASLFLPAVQDVVNMDFGRLMEHPLVIMGVVDLGLGLLLALEVVSVYPFVRFRAAFGFGLLCMIYWATDQPHLMLAAAAGSLGLFLGTFALTYATLGLAMALGLGGMIYLVVQSLL